ncbi:MAG: PorT family protein [Cyclobacteriaceae bacterium]|nr:PorT family protein [Cyclobacteriaceae bacterium]
MKLRALFFISAVALLPLLAQSQVRFGVTTALNATFVLDEGISNDPRYNSTMTYNWAPVGFNFGVDVGRKFGLQLESILSNQGQIYQVIDAAQQVAGQRNIELQYLNVPLLFKFMNGSSKKVRSNFFLGPQFSFLTAAQESLKAQAGVDYVIPEGMTFDEIQSNFAQFGGEVIPGSTTDTYQLESDFFTEIDKSSNAFRNTEFQIAAAFGFDIDLAKHFMLSAQIRANYSLTDMTNEEAFKTVSSGNGSALLSARANLLVGVQLGLHYVIGGTRSFKGK